MRCVVIGCTHNTNNNNKKLENKYRFYRFPKDRQLQKQWLHFCGRADDLNMETARICHVHFVPENFERNLQFEMGFTTRNGYKLKADVVPSIEPAKEESKERARKKTKQYRKTKTTETTIKWHKWCRLCAKEDSMDNINIFYNEEPPTSDSMMELGSVSDSGDYSNFSGLNAFIEKCFSITILPDDSLPKTLCSECLTLITNLESFAERVKNAQKMFLTLQETKTKSLDIHELRLKYGLSDYSKEQQMSRTKSKELEENLIECNMPTEPEHNDPLEKPNSCAEIKIEEQILEQEIPMSNYIENLKNVEVLENKEKTYDEETVCVEISAAEMKNKPIELNAANINQDNPKALTEEDINEILSDLRMKRAAQRLKSRQIITCYKCARIFTNHTMYERHARTHLPKGVKITFTCPHCSKKFPKKYVLNNHIACVHENVQRCVCHKCGAVLKSSCNLRGHMRTHSDAMLFNCKICTKGFNRRIAYEGHMDTHNTDKKFICPICGQKLNSRHTLKNHLIVHSDVRKFVCDYCKKAFKYSRNLKNHLLIHAGLKPYACKFCERTFANKSCCSQHEKKVHAKDAALLKKTGEDKAISPNVPTLSTLKAIIKTGNNLHPVAVKRRKSKQLIPLELNDIESTADEKLVQTHLII